MKKKFKKLKDKYIRSMVSGEGSLLSGYKGDFSGEEVEGGGIRIKLSDPIRHSAEESRQVFAVELPEEFQKMDRATNMDEVPNEVTISFSSERPVRVYGENEILSHEPGNADFSRLAEVGAILKNHNPNIIVGRPTKVWIDDSTRKGKVVCEFGTTNSALTAKREVLIDKTLRGVSVGYSVSEYIYLPDADTTYMGRMVGPAYVATKWEALEASFTPIAADPSVGVNRSQSQGNDAGKERKGRKSMDKKFRTWILSRGINPDDCDTDQIITLTREYETALRENKTVSTDIPAAPEAGKTTVDDDNKAREIAATEERQRINGIMTICRSHQIEDSVRDKFVEDGISLDAARAQVLESLSERSKAMGGSVRVTEDERSKFCRAMGEGLEMRSTGKRRSDAKHGGESFANMTLREMAKECLKRANIDGGSDIRSIVDRALEGPKLHQDTVERFERSGEIISGSTSDFPYILAATANKSMLAGYENAPTTYEQWCKIGQLSDFKATNRIKLSEAGDLQKILEGGKYPETAFSEDQNPIQVYTYGLKFNISRQAIINDDMDAFTSLPMRLGRSARRLPNQLAVVNLLANGLMNDGLALFSTGHNNYSASASYAMDTLAKAIAGTKNLIKTLRKQKGMLHAQEVAVSKTLTLNLQPNLMLVGAENEFTAKQTMASASDPGQDNSGVPNPVMGAANVVVEPLLEDTNITGYSELAYYLFANPMDAPVIEVAFLNGVREPYMEEQDQTDADGRVWKVRLDCGAASVDYAGAVKEKGEA